MMKQRALILSTAAFLAAAPQSASAVPLSGAVNADPQAGAGSGSAEDIVVTAQKRSQALIDVPQSISVVSGTTLELQQATSFQDYLKLVPGLQLTESTPGAGRLILRGINAGGVASTVAVYVDETPFGSSSGLVNGAVLAGDFDTFDLSRIEVLRGPQGTFYGSNSLGGILKFVTNAPDPTTLSARGRGGVEAVEGGQVSYYGNAVVNVPLTPTLAVRASGFYRRDGGFIDSIGTGGSDRQNDINSDRVYGGRASILFEPSSKFSFRASAILQNIEAKARSTVESDPDTLSTLYGQPTLSQFVPSFSNVAYRVYNGTGHLDLGFVDVSSSTSYGTQRQTSRTDATNNLSGLINAIFKVPNELYLGQNTNDDKFTEEMRLTKSLSFIDLLAGVYYTNERGYIRQEYVAVVPGTLTPATGLPQLALVNLRSRYEETAGFGNATLHFGEHFDLDLGGRYSHNSQRANQDTAGALAGGTSIFPTATSAENVFTYSAAPKVKFGENLSVYGRVAKGYRPGGPNVLPPGAPPGTPTSYTSDTLTNYEVGIKAQTADRTFSIDADIFYIDWKNIQLLAIVNNFGINVNAGKARSDGFELTATVRPTPGLNFSVNGAYTHARLVDDAGPLVGGRPGDALPFTPKYSVNLNGDYAWSIGDMLKPFVGVSSRFLSKQPGDFDQTFRTTNGRQRQLPQYTVVDLRAGADFGRFGLEAYVKNVTNAEGKTSTGAAMANGGPINPNGAVATGVIRPRTVGLALTAAL
ncbi:TonB-dependent receptor [Glacieibacterium megasporae]|uniref:TonB-dependent receptor n=1 Tax=Glacieibacterium megasporae TaxID=2835787 RepID=UPI001C1E074F|nr:TonB-dependent receptor [Polymorphobacter megasporae]UAJ10607.1 TonB-dependent receptor [Polymorphobacter megasporae]